MKNEKKRPGFGKILGKSLIVMLVVCGLFGFLILSHEGYHYITVSGDAEGICFGKCASTNGAMMISGVYFDKINTGKTNLEANERNAWVFSLLLTSLIGSFTFYSFIRYD